MTGPSIPLPDLIANLRHRFAHMVLHYPTDPLNVGLCVLGGLSVLLSVLLDTAWTVRGAALLTLIAGITGIMTARSRFVIRALPVTIGGATLALGAVILALAP
ncbi:MAG: hypothetical protein JW910_20060, partial [Anaerolineae bacterium]|nr:hypothetical protein [Anaerolineae bacterium]